MDSNVNPKLINPIESKFSWEIGSIFPFLNPPKYKSNKIKIWGKCTAFCHVLNTNTQRYTVLEHIELFLDGPIRMWMFPPHPHPPFRSHPSHGPFGPSAHHLPSSGALPEDIWKSGAGTRKVGGGLGAQHCAGLEEGRVSPPPASVPRTWEKFRWGRRFGGANLNLKWVPHEIMTMHIPQNPFPV